jgi:hypothetical protein
LIGTNEEREVICMAKKKTAKKAKKVAKKKRK